MPFHPRRQPQTGFEGCQNPAQRTRLADITVDITVINESHGKCKVMSVRALYVSRTVTRQWCVVYDEGLMVGAVDMRL